MQTFTSKNAGKEFTKREIVLVDKTNREVSCLQFSSYLLPSGEVCYT